MAEETAHTVPLLDNQLDRRVVVVTGTSRGIGRSIAVRLARSGATVIGCSRQDTGPGFLEDLPSELAERCRTEICDVSKLDDVEKFSRKIAAQMGAPDVLINNAGVVVRASVEETRDEDWDAVLGANLTGTFQMTRAFVPAMKSRGGGRIINLSSIAGREGTSMLSAYCAAKHGVVGLTRSLAEELRPFRIAVNAICPGSVDTDMLRIGMPGGKPDMTPAQIADVALYLAASAPLAMTGSCVDVFG